MCENVQDSKSTLYIWRRGGGGGVRSKHKAITDSDGEWGLSLICNSYFNPKLVIKHQLQDKQTNKTNKVIRFVC